MEKKEKTNGKPSQLIRIKEEWDAPAEDRI
jgi:hypothetical protein